MNLIDDTLVVIRSSGERTESLCLGIIKKQVPQNNVKIIKEKPFEKALQVSLELGALSNKSWTIVIDADTLLFENSVKVLRSKFEKLPNHVFMLQGLIFDRILGVFKPAGHRIYRTNLLVKAIPLIPAVGEYIRPEFETLNRMSKKGFKSIFLKDFLGLHDYEQFYKDLYRTAFVHSKKHQARIQEIVTNCTTNLTKDESKVVLQGLMDGLLSPNDVKLDVGWFDELSKHALSKMGIQEREQIQGLSVAESYVWIRSEKERILSNYKIVGDSKKDRIIHNITQKGFIKGNLYSLSKILENLSK